MKKAIKITLWCLFALIVVGVFVFLFMRTRPKKTHYAVEKATVVDSIENKTLLSGSVSPRDEVLIKPQLNGIIAEVLCKPGDVVKQGDVLARIEVLPEMMQTANAESSLRMAEIAFNEAKEQYDRSKKLFESGVVAREEHEAATARYLKAKEQLDNGKEALEIVRTGRSSRTASSSSTLVRATISGTVLTVPVKVGSSVIQANTFNEGTTVASIADMNDMVFIGKVDETIIGKLHLGMPTRVRIGALQGKEIDASIEYIAPKGITENGSTTYEVRAALNNEKTSELRSGYGANAEVILEGVYKVTAIPENCIFYRNDSTFVSIVTKEKPELETKERYVVCGLSDGVSTEIKSGLKPGEKVRGLEIMSN